MQRERREARGAACTSLTSSAPDTAKLPPPWKLFCGSMIRQATPLQVVLVALIGLSPPLVMFVLAAAAGVLDLEAPLPIWSRPSVSPLTRPLRSLGSQSATLRRQQPPPYVGSAEHQS